VAVVVTGAGSALSNPHGSGRRAAARRTTAATAAIMTTAVGTSDSSRILGLPPRMCFMSWPVAAPADRPRVVAAGFGPLRAQIPAAR